MLYLDGPTTRYEYLGGRSRTINRISLGRTLALVQNSAEDARRVLWFKAKALDRYYGLCASEFDIHPSDGVYL